MPDPWAWWSAEKIAAITKSPVENVRENWPIIADALDAQGIYDRDVARGVIGTVAIETASTFQPVREAYWLPESWRQSNLRYFPFYGRGFDQTTWENGYRDAGQFLGRDLLTNPDLLLRADLSAKVLAWRFATKGVPQKDGSRFWTFAQLCRAHDWEWLRRGIQGGTDGLDRLEQIVNDLGGDAVTVPYNPAAKIDQQSDDWSCSIQSAEWLLRSLGRNPGDQWIQDQLLNAGIVSRDNGLMVSTGQQLADWLSVTYGREMGWQAQASPVTFDDVWAGAGQNPMICGGRKFGPAGHWIGIRGRNPDGTLSIANPANGYDGIGQSMSRDQWNARGSWSCIWIDRGAAPVTPPAPSRAQTLLAEIEARVAELKTLVA